MVTIGLISFLYLVERSGNEGKLHQYGSWFYTPLKTSTLAKYKMKGILIPYNRLFSHRFYIHYFTGSPGSSNFNLVQTL